VRRLFNKIIKNTNEEDQNKNKADLEEVELTEMKSSQQSAR
jgi:hypothetical protein